MKLLSANRTELYLALANLVDTCSAEDGAAVPGMTLPRSGVLYSHACKPTSLQFLRPRETKRQRKETPAEY